MPFGFHSQRMHSRSGFTLTEILVTVGLFLGGFSVVYGLFLTGARQRALADSMSLTAIAATSISAEIRMAAGYESKDPSVQDYVGNGLANDGTEADFIRYHDVPNIFYRVDNCKKIGNAATLTVFQADLLVYMGQGTTLTWTDLVRRHRILNPDLIVDNQPLPAFNPNFQVTESNLEGVIEQLVDSGRLHRYPLVIHRVD